MYEHTVENVKVSFLFNSSNIAFIFTTFLRTFIEVNLDIYNTESNQTIPYVTVCIFRMYLFLGCVCICSLLTLKLLGRRKEMKMIRK